MEKQDKKYKKTIVIPIEYKMWESLRKISYEKHISMSQLTRWSLEKIIDKFEKPVDLEQ